MSISSRFRSFFSKSDANGPQRRKVVYSVFVTANQATSANLILPIPPKTTTQMIENEPVFSIPPTTIATENKYGNRYAVWSLDLSAKQTKEIKMSLGITIAPVQLTDALKSIDLSSDYTSDEAKKYLTGNRYIEPTDSRIKEIASEIVTKNKTLATVVNACNDHVVKTLKYGNPIPGLYSASQALSEPLVDCGGYDTLLVSLLNACGVPARIVSGFWLSTPQQLSVIGYWLSVTPEMHAWVEILLPDGSWLPADPSVEQLRKQKRSKKIGALGKIGSDRIIASFGCDMLIQVGGRTTPIGILQTPTIHPNNSNINLAYSVSASHLAPFNPSNS